MWSGYDLKTGPAASSTAHPCSSSIQQYECVRDCKRQVQPVPECGALWGKNLRLTLSRVAVLFLTVNLFGGISGGHPNHHAEFLPSFEHIGMNIFVPVTITGPKGRSETVDFILDSGSNSTTIDSSVMLELALIPYRISRNLTASGTAIRNTTQISHFCSLSQCAENLEVLVDDLSLYTNGYGRRVAGLLAMDFLKEYILVIDFPNSKIGLFPADTELKYFAKSKMVSMISDKNLALVEAVLPNGKIIRLIFDTGYDSLADALLYECASGEMSFVQTGNSEIKDQNGSYATRFGTIQSLKIGEILLAPASVQLSKQVSAESSTLEYGGMIGIFPFRDRMIALDYPNLKLLVSIQSQPSSKE